MAVSGRDEPDDFAQWRSPTAPQASALLVAPAPAAGVAVQPLPAMSALPVPAASAAPRNSRRGAARPHRRRGGRLLVWGAFLLGLFLLWRGVTTTGFEAVPIADLRVGMLVPAANPTGEEDLEFGTAVEPATWRKVVLRAPKRDGSIADVDLLRPVAWREAQLAADDGVDPDGGHPTRRVRSDAAATTTSTATVRTSVVCRRTGPGTLRA